jgi:hypothetical protein
MRKRHLTAELRMPNGSIPVRACSACPGDYENPDRTACNSRDGEEFEDPEPALEEPEEAFEANEDEVSE